MSVARSASATFTAVTPTPLPSGPPAGAACPTTNSAVANSGGTQLGLGASRASGVAPLAVFFDATGTTSTSTTRPFHDLEYRWTFGESGSGTWNFGAKAGTASRNEAMGPVAAHVFESAGTYPITVSAFNGTATVSYSCNITVLDTDAEFVGGKTVCISGAGNFVGCPAGAVQVTTTNAVTAVTGNIGAGNKRILFRRGETFTVGSILQVSQNGPGIIGAFGVGAKPILNQTTSSSRLAISSITTPTMADWRIMDLQFEGNNNDTSAISGAGSASDILILRNDMRNLKFGLSFSPSNLDAINNSGYTSPEWSKFFIIDNTVNDLVGIANGSNGMYLGLNTSAVMGNYVNPNNKGEHGIRCAHETLSVFSHNSITGIPSGRAFLSLRSPDQGSSTFPSSVYGPYVYSEKNYVSDNRFYGGYTGGGSGVGPTNGTSTGRSREMIWERNLFEGSAYTSSELLTLVGVNITARNNIFIMINGNAIGSQPLANSPVPDGLWIYNNSVYASGTSARLFSIIGNEAGDMTASVFNIKNNVFYAPNTSNGDSVIINLVGATINVGGTSNSGSSERTTSPLFTTTPPTTAAHFKPTTGSYAIGRGVSVPAWSDYFEAPLTGSSDMGAVRH